MNYNVHNRIAYDVECYPNYFMVGFLLPDGTLYQYQFSDTDISQHSQLVAFINWVEQSDYVLEGFNSNGYDDLVLGEFINTPQCWHAYSVSKGIIEEGRPPWDFIQDIFSIDLMRILPGRMSLKKIGVCLGHKKLQELPIDPHKKLTPEQMEEIRVYNINDLEITQKLGLKIQNELELRQALSQQHGVDLRSKGEAQCAELILCSEMEKRTGQRKIDLKNSARALQDQRGGFTVKRPSWWRWVYENRRHELTEVVWEKGEEFYNKLINVYNYQIEPNALSSKLYLRDRWYQMGIGGLHSIDGPGAWVPKDDQILLDIDVTSYYPNLMLTQNWSPEIWNQGVDFFQEIFGEIVAQRIAAKDSGDKTTADRLKIVINGTFGKTNDQHSALYDPQIMGSVTVTGQLALLVLISWIQSVTEATVVSANTDGITLLLNKNEEKKVRHTVAEWEAMTDLTMDYEYYKCFYQKDVNNYIAVTTEGKTKTKGIFNIPKSGGVDLRHTPNAQIIPRAVTRYITHKSELDLNICSCDDIQEFIYTQQASRGWGVRWRDQELDRMVRFYKSESSKDPIMKYPISATVKGNTGIMANSENSVPLPDLPHSFTSIVDIDYNWYIDKARELLDVVDTPKRPGLNEMAMKLLNQGMIPATIEKGVRNRKRFTLGDIDFTSLRDDEQLAICTGRGYGVLAIIKDGHSFFYKVSNKYPAKSRVKILKDEGLELLFGCNVEVTDLNTRLLEVEDETVFDQYYTETELRKARE